MGRSTACKTPKVMSNDQTISMKKITTIILLNLVSVLSYGQTDDNKRKSVFLEIAGSGGLGSFNYEKLFFKKSNIELTWYIRKNELCRNLKQIVL